MPLVSVIVPVYKAEKWLHRCVDSILAQTMTDFELLLIDDGSPDRSGEICDEYAKRDSRVRVIHQDNQGVTKARAVGVENVLTSMWITFVDADDILPLTALSDLYNLTLIDDVDVVFGGVLRIKENSPIETNESLDAQVIGIEEFRRIIVDGKEGPVAKLFRRELFTPFVFDMPRDIVLAEDLVMNIRLVFRTNKNVIYTNKVVYLYLQNDSSCTHTFRYTPEYEEYLKKYIMDSIPQSEFSKYAKEYIKRRFIVWKHMYSYVVYPRLWLKTDFDKSLRSEIKKYNYEMTFIDKVLFYNSNMIVRFCFITYKKFRNLLK